jgi:actin-related protein
MGNDNLIKSIVIENSSDYYRIGFGGEDKPRYIFKIKAKSNNHENKADDMEITPLELNIKRDPIERGNIMNYDDITLVWDYGFKKLLKVDPIQHPVLIIDTPLNAFLTQENITKILFDHFKVPKFVLKASPELILELMAKKTGIVIDIQQEKIDFSVIWDSQLLRSDFLSIDVNYKDLEQQLPTICERIYQQIKRIKLLCHGGVELRKICAQNIILTGIGALIPNIKERMTQILLEIDLKIGGKPLEFIITAPTDPNNAAWIGGSNFATNMVHEEDWITSEEYHRNGAQIIHRLS